jgi:hypothetical protein
MNHFTTTRVKPKLTTRQLAWAVVSNTDVQIAIVLFAFGLWLGYLVADRL